MSQLEDMLNELNSLLDHGELQPQSLEDDDHLQYHTDARGDDRYFTKDEITTISGDIVSQIGQGISGWFDDGLNFRITVDNGLIVNLDYSVVGGCLINSGNRGLFVGGDVQSNNATIDYISMSTIGSAVDFGDLTVGRTAASCASSIRGVFSGGNVEGGAAKDVIDYVTVMNSSNASNFGDLSVDVCRTSSLSSNIRGVIALGQVASSSVNTVEYVTIAIQGNSMDFGDLTQARDDSGTCASPTRGIFGGGHSTQGEVHWNVIDYVTIASTGNATDFGDLISNSKTHNGASSNYTRGIFGGGHGGSYTDIVEYITIDSTGNASSFGNLSTVRSWLGGCSNLIRSIFGGGYTTDGGIVQNIIEYVSIATTGNAVDFGDLTEARYGLTGTSNCHGGIA
jgi:hypothetical protein